VGKTYFIGSGDSLKDFGEKGVPNWKANGVAPYFLIGQNVFSYKKEGTKATDLKIAPGQLITGLKAASGFILQEEGVGQDVSESEIYAALAAAAGTPQFFIEQAEGKFAKYPRYIFEGRIKSVGVLGFTNGVAKIVITPVGKSDWTVEVNVVGYDFGRAWLSTLGENEFQELEAAEDKPDCLSQFYQPNMDVICVCTGGGKPEKVWNVWHGRKKLTTTLITLMPRPTDLPPLDITEREEPQEVTEEEQSSDNTPAPNPQRAQREEQPAPTEQKKITVGGDKNLDTVSLMAKIVSETGMSGNEIKAKTAAKQAELKGLIKEEAALVVIAKELGVNPEAAIKQTPAKVEETPEQLLAKAKNFVEYIAKSNPGKNWTFPIEDYNEMAIMEGAPQDFTKIFPFPEFEEFCAIHQVIFSNVKSELKPAEVKPVSKLVEVIPEVKPEPKPEIPATITTFVVTEELHDKVYEIILTKDSGNGVSIKDIQAGLGSGISLPNVKKILDVLCKETAIGATRPGFYQPL
jgi:hypothetical protein